MLTTYCMQELIADIGRADILVGIPSYNNARTIGHVVRAVQAGLAKYFPQVKSVIVNSDGGSTDGTPDIVSSATINDFDSILLKSEPKHHFRFAFPYHGVPGKGSAFKAIFELAARLGVRACVVVDADLRSITPEWIELLAKPVFEESYDYVAPLYRRHKHDGTITNSVIYPLTRALYGKRVRQPIGGDFGFSGDLAKLYLGKNVWDTDVARYGIDIWMTTTAIASGFRVCQAFLGAKIHDPKDPAADLSSMLAQVVGATFDLMEEYRDAWGAVHSSESVRTFGFEYEVGLEPINVNVERMRQRFALGVKELAPLYGMVLTPEVVTFLQTAAARSSDEPGIPDATWAEILYRFAIAARRKIMNRDHLLRSLTPLYLGKVASFVAETKDSDGLDVERKIENLCAAFEERKELLVANWPS